MRIVLATGNPGKLAEIRRVLAPLRCDIVAQSELGVPAADETGLSFVENAIIKARNASLHTGLPALADDSGLEVDVLGGAPGIHSARYAGPDNDDQANNSKLLNELEGLPVTKRRARFQCAVAFLKHAGDPVPLICQASWEGHIADAPRGDNGFGYDPLFVVDGVGCRSAELEPDRKNQLSHRGQALRELLGRLPSKL